MRLQFKNKTPQKLICAFLCSGGTIILFLVGLLIGLIAEQSMDFFAQGAIIFVLMLLLVWLIFLAFIFVFHKTVSVSEEEICLRKGCKIIWTIKKEEILECTYSKIFANKKFYPEAGAMYFKLKPNGRYAKRKIKDGIYVDNYIGISYASAKKIMELGYNVFITNERIKQNNEKR